MNPSPQFSHLNPLPSPYIEKQACCPGNESKKSTWANYQEAQITVGLVPLNGLHPVCSLDAVLIQGIHLTIPLDQLQQLLTQEESCVLAQCL